MAVRYREADMTPVEKLMRPTYQSSRRPGGQTREECWEAYSLSPDGKRDNLFAYLRLDGQPGTPWEIVHIESAVSYTGMLYGSLNAARCDTHTRLAEILATILNDVRKVADDTAYLPATRDRARAAIPGLEARVAALAAMPVPA